MSFGVTVTGFNRKRFSDIMASLAANQAPIFDVDIESVRSGKWPAPQDIIGQIDNSFALEYDEGWGELEAVWQSGDPNKASGVSLDQILAQNLLTRLAAKSTAVQVALKGTEGTLVPAGTLLKISVTGDQFAAAADVTISRSSIVRALFHVSTVANTTVYTTTINGTAYNFTSSGSATAINIAAGLVAALAAQTAAAVVDNLDGTYSVESSDLSTPFSFNVDSRQAVNSLESPQQYAAVQTGPIKCLATKLDTIVTPVSGLDSVSNLLDAVIGRDLETDHDARVRRFQTMKKNAKATIDAITGKLLSDVNGVTGCFAINNITNSPDADGVPAHSVSFIVVGGSDLDIANVIFQNLCAGINTYGNENADGTQAGGNGTGITVTDAQGFPQVIHFGRPVKKYVWVQAELHLYSEEIFPDGGRDLVSAAILNLGNSFNVGEDIFVDRLKAPCFSIPGIGSIVMVIAITDAPTDSPSYGSGPIAISKTQIAEFDSGRILVTIA